MSLSVIVAVAFAIAGVAGVLYWLLVTTEGVYLGRRVVIWLYDVYSRRYDDIKQFQPFYDHMLLAQPLMDRIRPHQSPLILDVATGTGRFPDALLNHGHFQGRIFAIDLSRKMLSQAAEKLASDGERVELIWCPAENLPFDDDTFDVVTCLEALEFMPDPVEALREAVRVLRPGGLLLTTNRIGRHMMPGKTFSQAKMEKLLADFGIEQVVIEPWQVDYQRVWGIKAGKSLVTGARPLIEVLRCPASSMRENGFIPVNAVLWQCAEHTEALVMFGEDGVLELLPLYHH